MREKILVLGLVLALVAVMAMPLAVSAAGSDSGGTTVEGEMGDTYSIAIGTNPINLGTLSTTTAVQSSAFTITVTTNTTDTSVKIGVNGIDGKLSNGGTVLNEALQIKSTTLGQATYSNITSSKVDFVTSLNASSGSASADDVQIQQPAITNTNPAAGTYSETITFTATFAPSP